MLIFLALWLGSEYQRADQIRTEIQRSSDHRRDVEQLMLLMQDAETGQRGYVLTGISSFLDPYRNAQAELETRLAAVASTVVQKPAEKAKFARLKSLIAAKFAEMQLVLNLRNKRGLDVAASRVADQQGKILMDNIRQVIGEMTLAESASLDKSLEAYQTRVTKTQHFIWIAIAAIALLACILGYALGKGKRQRSRLAIEREEAAARRKAIFDSSTDGIILINPSGSIETINPAAERMFGYSADEVLRRDISTLVDVAPGQGLFLERLGLRNGALDRPSILGQTGKHKDGNPVFVDIVFGMMPLPDGVHIVATLRDVSDRKEVERMKDEFISTVSHELRTPLTSVLGSLSLLRSGAAGEMPAQAQRLAVIAENNCQRLIRLINDILDIDKIQAGTMTFDYSSIDLREVAKRAAQAMQGLADQKNIGIVSELPETEVMVRADLERLVQVSTNLISNAVRYSPNGSTINLVVTTRDGAGIVEVRDQGPGISDEFKRRIFNRFAQGSRPDSEAISGTGLGLAISREIIRNHGGEIGFDNQPAGGACFSFSVPSWHIFDFGKSDDGRKVLICEDDVDAAETLRLLLHAQGLHADVVHSARAAQVNALSGRYDALLLDLRLPDGSGIDVIRAVRSSDTVRELPIIIISGSEPKSTTLPASVDIIDWIEKPVDPNRLVRAVEIALSRVPNDQPVILHVEDDSDTLEIFSTALANRGRVVGVRNLASARAFLQHRTPDVVILDLGLPDGSGAELLPALIDDQGQALPTIIYSAQDVSGELQRSVEAVLTKSRRTLPSLVNTVTRILEGKRGELIDS